MRSVLFCNRNIGTSSTVPDTTFFQATAFSRLLALVISLTTRQPWEPLMNSLDRLWNFSYPRIYLYTTSHIPQLQFKLCPILLNNLSREITTNCRTLMLIKLFQTESSKQRCLANSSIPHDNDLHNLNVIHTVLIINQMFFNLESNTSLSLHSSNLLKYYLLSSNPLTKSIKNIAN